VYSSSKFSSGATVTHEVLYSQCHSVPQSYLNTHEGSSEPTLDPEASPRIPDLSHLEDLGADHSGNNGASNGLAGHNHVIDTRLPLFLDHRGRNSHLEVAGR